MTQEDTINITPNPKILATIAQNPMKPVDALSELIDNSLDGFASALQDGEKIDEPTIIIDIPSISEVEKGLGVLRVSDNGLGLTRTQASNAVTAGFSGHDNPVDRLGLYGMGFNISTAKLGQQTKFISKQLNDEDSFKITVDIPKMITEKSFDAAIESVKKSEDEHGATVEVTSWWPKGHQNEGFIKELARHSKPKLREQLGRRYSTLIEQGYKISVNGEMCPQFKHCVWTDKRFVERKEYGKIPAKIYIDVNLGQEFRCSNCWQQLDDINTIKCPNCSAEDTVRVIDKRIKGWVGIQRFDDASNFGVDLLRNGRVIRDFEKEAFFTFRDEDNVELKDYPIDSQYGRIIGELHMNHVPVNYLKTDFDRTSIYWQEAIEFLRGKTSLQPTRADGKNDSVIYKLFQGYRKVREPGTKDLYMGYYNVQKNRPERIDRAVEQEYYEKFKNNEVGYGFDDDSEWYKKVLEAEIKPAIGLKECPEGHQNIEDAEVCTICGYLFDKKTCINDKCKKEIPKSALTCPHCGKEQDEGTEEFWDCAICNAQNPPSMAHCTHCGASKGAQDPFSESTLKENSNISEDLSIKHHNVELPGEDRITIDSTVYLMKQDTKLTKNGTRVPALVQHSNNNIEIFIDQSHPAFLKYQDRHEDYVALEIANFIRDEKSSRIPNEIRSLWSLSNIYFLIHDQIWKERTKLDHVTLIGDIDRFFSELRERLEFILREVKSEVYSDLSTKEQEEIYKSAIQAGVDVNDLEKSGKYLRYLPMDALTKLVSKYPAYFFDGNFWNQKYSKLSEQLSPEINNMLKESAVENYISSINDIVRYRRMSVAPNEVAITNRVFYSLTLVSNNVS